MPAVTRGRRIVAGIDGSAPSRAALAWAIGQAQLTGAVIDAVIAWRYRPTTDSLWRHNPSPATAELPGACSPQLSPRFRQRRQIRQ